LPVKSPKDLVALAKSKPGQITYASSGSGSPHHLGVELLASAAGIRMIHVPYKGAAPAVTDLLGGQVSLGIVALSASLPHVRTGKLTALGVTSLKRTVFAPDVPTIAESGFPGYEVEFWMGVMAPSATPREIVTRLNSEIVKILQMPDVRERFHSQGFEIYSSTPQQFSAYIKAEIQKWAKVVKESGAKVD
jgi:tripartite-type tricarboxylate transporter receptor subunit TctC